jgi:aerobic carbon-monoxide dehydrogenase medium subunit
MSTLRNIDLYRRPATLAEALAVLQKPGTRVLAGGTHLLTDVGDARVLVDINKLGLSYIKRDAAGLRIGATTTLQEICSNSSTAGIIAEAAKATTVSRQLRNVKTIAGEIVSSKPESLLSVVLLALDARLKIVDSSEKENVLTLDRFYKGKRAVGGIISEIEIPSLNGNAVLERLSIIESSIPIMSVAVALGFDGRVCKHARVAVGSGVNTPHRVLFAEGQLLGRPIDETVIGEASDIVSQQIKCITDTRGSADYRKAITRVLTKRALIKASKDVLESAN